MNGSTPSKPRAAAMGTGLAAALLWAYWLTFAEMAARWSSDPQYSHGYLVPAFAGLLLWQRRARLPAVWQSHPAGGGLMALALLLRCLAGHADIAVLDASVERVISPETLCQGVDFTPFAGLAARGWPRHVLLRGVPIVQDGALRAGPGTGRFVQRRLP
uniref:Uncharacterized protein n=1 Tax=Fundidesulfovibrio putealis TaxID=270496 RepID=A0A7C4AHB2_9BACT